MELSVEIFVGGAYGHLYYGFSSSMPDRAPVHILDRKTHFFVRRTLHKFKFYCDLAPFFDLINQDGPQ